LVWSSLLLVSNDKEHDDKQQPRYADNFRPFTAPEQGLLTQVGITRTSA
jgi:hypothetical protein